MSSVAVSGLVPVDAPLPRERLHSLLTVPGVVVPQEQLEEHWEGGVAMYGFPNIVPGTWEGCSEGTFRVKDGENSPGTVENFVSFVIAVGLSCSTMGISEEVLDRRAEAVLRATRAYALEQALVAGVDGLPNPYLGDAGLTVLTGSAVSAGVGLSYLDEAIAQTGQGGMIHITPAVADALTAIPSGDEGAASPVYSSAGTPIAIGAGYTDAVPDGESAPGATEDYIFATGPVEVRVDEAIESHGVVEHATNDYIYWAEQVAVVTWDPNLLQVAALVDWSL